MTFPCRVSLSPTLVWLFAAGLAALAFALDGPRGFNVADEGVVWHAAWRTRHGDVPIRDFLSYDAGRHYWQAAWMWLLGSDGLLALRVADTLFQALGLTAGLFALTRVTSTAPVLMAWGLLLMLAMTPGFKMFESSLAMITVLAGVRLLEDPQPTRYLQAGVLVGVAGFIGRNLGLYALFSLGLLALVIAMRERRACWREWSAFFFGVVAGYAPAWLMALFVPGFASAMWDSIVRLFEVGAGNNLTLPVPWPWTLALGELTSLRAWAELFRGISYLMIMIFLVAVPAWLWLLRGRPEVRSSSLLLAAWAVMLAYAHHAYGRAGASHLAQSLHPYLIGLAAVGGYSSTLLAWRRTLSIAGMCLLVVGVAGVAIVRPVTRELLSSGGPWVWVRIASDQIAVPAPLAREIAAFQEIHDHCVGVGEAMFVAPAWPALYPMVGMKAPAWDNYFMFKETPKRQQRLIAQLEAARTAWVFLDESGIDGREDRRFRNTYPLVYQWIQDNFVEAEPGVRPGRHRVLYRRDLFLRGDHTCKAWKPQ